MRAARHYQLSPDEISFDLVGKRHGFVKRRRRVIVRVDPQQPRREPRENEPRTLPRREIIPAESQNHVAPVAEPGPRERVGGEKLPKRDLRKAEGALAMAVEKSLDLALHFLHLTPEVKVLEGDGFFEVELSGRDAGFLLANDGAVLWALEDLLPRFVFGLVGETVAVRVDSNGYRRQRDEELRRLALDAASEVRRSGRARALDALSPAERKVIHETLAADPRVTSKSEGRGFRRQVVIRSR